MCASSRSQPETYTPAAAPAAPLPAAPEPTIGDTRRQQNIAFYGKETPSYKAREGGSGTSVNMTK